MGPNGRAAIRSTSMSHVDDQLQTALQEEHKQTQRQEDEEMRALKEIASLSNHPGWRIVQNEFMDTIEEYRSGRKLTELLKDYTLSDAQVGQATRNMNIIAEELTRVLNSVTLAASEVERRKEEERNATQQRMARRN